MKPNQSTMEVSTLTYLIRNEEVLLGLKKSGFGEGKLNGYGGKIDQSTETVTR